MSFSAMDLGWKRIHLLVVILIFLKHAVGHEGWRSPNVQPQQNWPLRRVRSSMLEAPVSGSLNPSRSRFSLSRQSVKGGFSSSYEPVSPIQSAPSVSDSDSSLLRLQGSPSQNAQNVVSQSASRPGSYSWSALSSQDVSGLQGVSAQLASTPAQGGSSSGLPILSQSSPSLFTPGSLSKLSVSPLAISGLPTSDQSSSNMFTASSQSNSGLQLGGTSSLLSTQSSSSTGSSESSRRLFSSQGSSGPQLAGGSSQLTSTSGLLALSPSTESQRTSGSSYAKLAASPLGFSQSSSGQSSYSQYTSSSQSRVGTRVAASPQYQPGQGSGYGLSVQPQGTTSQYAPSRFSSLSSAGGSFSSADGSSVQSQGTSNQNALSPFGPKVPVYSQAAPSGPSLSLSQPSQWQSSVSSSQSFQTSGAVASQSSSPSQGIKAPSRFSTSLGSPSQFASTQEGSGRYSGLSVQSQSTSSLYSPGPSAYAKLAASPQGVGQSTSGQSSYSQYTSSSQTRAGTPLAGVSRFAPMQTGSTFTDGSTSSRYALAALDAKVPVYSQAASSGSSALSQKSTSRWSQGTGTSGTVASQSSSPSQGSKAPSRFSALASVASPSQFASTQEGSVRYSGLSIQGTSSPYSPLSSGYAKPAPSPLGVSQSTSGLSSYSQYTSSSQSRADPQLAGSSPYAPIRRGGTSTDGSSLQMQGTFSQYAPSLSSAKVYSLAAPSGLSLSPSQPSQWQTSSRWSPGFQTSDTVASQSGSLSQASKAPSRFPTLSSAPSPGQLVPTQEGTARYSDLSIQSQSTSSQYSPWSSGYAKPAPLPLGVSQSTSGPSSYSQYTSSSQSRAVPQLAGSSPYAPIQRGGTSTDGSSLQMQGTSSQYAPSLSSAKVYSPAAPSGPSLSPSQPAQWQTSSRWSQGFQTSDTVASQSGSLSQASKTPSRFPTLSSAPSPGQFASTQEGSGRYGGLSSLSQGTSSQYGSGSLAYAKRGSSLTVSSQSTSDQSSSGLYASGTQLAGSSRYVPLQTGSKLTGGSSFQFQGTSNQYAPSVSSQYTQASPSGSSLTGSSGKWQTSASTWSQGFQASGAAVPPQSSQTSSGSSFLPALSPSVDSLAQSSSSSSRKTTSFFGVGLRPSKLTAQAASGSTISSQLSPALSADSMTSSLGSSVQGASQGTFSGQSSDSTSVISSSYGSDYGQSASGFSRSSQGSSATGRYSSVKG